MMTMAAELMKNSLNSGGTKNVKCKIDDRRRKAKRREKSSETLDSRDTDTFSLRCCPRLIDAKMAAKNSSFECCRHCETLLHDRFTPMRRKLVFSTIVLLVLTYLANCIPLAVAEPALRAKIPISSTTDLPLKQDNSPHFDNYRVENHTVQLGGIAFLPCIIKNLGNRSVSWIRGRDSHILTVDKEVFITDRRVSTIHQKDSATWMLQIKSVQPYDAGKYECQISTEPKLSHFVYLTVIVPHVRIFGDRDIFVKSSSTVQLKCVITQSLTPPTYIEWFRNEDERLPSSYLGLSSPFSSEYNSRMQATPPEHLAEGTTISTLTILTAKPSDSGRYTCKPAQLEQASVNLHVIESDLPALMQTSQGISKRWYSKLFFASMVAQIGIAHFIFNL